MSSRSASVSRIALAGLLVIVVGGADVHRANDEDLLPIGSTWRGRFTQQGEHNGISLPPELEATLTITDRNGDQVDLELRETLPGMDITFLCRGRVTRAADMSLGLQFRSYGVKNVGNAGFFVLDVPYTARLVDDAIKGTWKYVDRDQGINLSGDFVLKRE